jgi:hypothetical protein
MQMSFWSKGRGTVDLADPYHVWDYIVVLSEDHAWGDIRFTSPGLSTPGIERRSDLPARPLMGQWGCCDIYKSPSMIS